MQHKSNPYEIRASLVLAILNQTPSITDDKLAEKVAVYDKIISGKYKSTNCKEFDNFVDYVFTKTLQPDAYGNSCTPVIKEYMKTEFDRLQKTALCRFDSLGSLIERDSYQIDDLLINEICYNRQSGISTFLELYSSYMKDVHDLTIAIYRPFNDYESLMDGNGTFFSKPSDLRGKSIHGYIIDNPHPNTTSESLLKKLKSELAPNIAGNNNVGKQTTYIYRTVELDSVFP